MGPIQTAIGQLMGVVGASAVAAKKMQNENERQTAKEAGAEKAEDQARAAALNKALKIAQEKKIDSPKQVYFWGDSENAIGTSNEIASVLSTQSLSNATASKRRARDKVRERKQMLEKRKLVAR